MTAQRLPPNQQDVPNGAQPVRERLLIAALKLFAHQGYAKTSIRAIATEARANVAAVSYYFGDKAALYATLFSVECGDIQSLIPVFTQPGLSLREALQSYFEGMLASLNAGESARLHMRLHMREMLEPTSQWAIEIEKDWRQPHDAMARLLCQHMGRAQADDNIHRLAVSISGLAHNLWIQQELVNALLPQLLGSSAAVAQWADRMTEYALAMVSAEQRVAALHLPATSARS